MEKDNLPEKKKAATGFQLSAVMKQPAKREWAPHAPPKPADSELSERLRARAELVRSSLNCGGDTY